MERNIDQINVIPLVDVMLVLLVIALTPSYASESNDLQADLLKA